MNNLQSLIADGTCICYIDYRSGLTRDWSENGNNASATDASFFQRQYMSIADSDDFDFRNGGSVVVFGKFQQQDSSGLAFAVKGANEWYFYSYDDDLNVYDGTTFSTYSFGEYKNFECAGASFGNGSKASFYLDGAFVDQGANTLNNITDGAGNVACGHSVYGSRNYVLDAAVFFNRQLTAEEHAAVYQELKNVKWPTKQYSQVPANLSPLPSSCVAAIDGQWAQSGLVNRAEPSVIAEFSNDTGGEPNVTEKCLLGTSVKMAEYTTTKANLTGRPLTMSCWVRMDDDSSNQIIWGNTFAGYRFVYQAGLGMSYRLNANNKIVYFQDDMVEGVWTHLCVTHESDGTITMYRDGVPDGVTDSYTTNWPAVATMRYGFDAGYVSTLQGQSTRARIYNQALTADEVLAEYQEGAQAIQFKTEWGYREKSSSTAGDFVGPFEVLNGNDWQLTSDTIQGQLCKVLDKGGGNGHEVVLPWTGVMSSNDAAYGTWEFWFSHAQSTASQIMFAAQEKLVWNSGSQNGYFLQFNTDGSLQLRKLTAGSATTLRNSDATPVSANTWHHIKVTRNNPGDFYVYVDGTAIGSVATDTSFESAEYMVCEMDAGDKLAIASPQGQYAITKRLGVY